MEQATLTELLNSPSGGILERPILLKRIEVYEKAIAQYKKTLAVCSGIISTFQEVCEHKNKIATEGPSVGDPAWECLWRCAACKKTLLSR